MRARDAAGPRRLTGAFVQKVATERALREGSAGGQALEVRPNACLPGGRPAGLGLGCWHMSHTLAPLPPRLAAAPSRVSLRAALLCLGLSTACASAGSATRTEAPPATAPTAAQSAPAPASTPGADLRGCEALRVDGGVEYRCPTHLVSVYDVDAPVSQALKEYMEGLQQGLEGRGTVSGLPVEEAAEALPGRTAMRVRIQWQEQAGLEESEGYVLIFERGPGRSRVASCMTDAAPKVSWEVCDASLRRMPDLSAVAPAQSAPVELLGRTVTPPPGCEAAQLSPSSQAVSCPESNTSMMWASFNEPLRKETLDEIVGGLAQKVKVTRDESVACQLGGQEALCRRVTLAAEGDDFSAVIGLTEEQQHMVVVQCTFPGGASGALPEVCRGVFTLK